MPTSKELRQAYHDTYKTILGRNSYNQGLRDYCYKPYKGQYYSDCSSSICLTMNKIGISMSALNTEGMHFSKKWTKVDVDIANGHIAQKDVHKLRVGDALMFRGSDSSRPLKIGHTESIFEINGDTEYEIVLAGHGSGTPSVKNCYDYCEKRRNQKASGGWNKGLVEVLRAIPDDDSENETNEEYVACLYRELLNREPDEGGLNHWVSQLNNGMSKADIENAIKGSQGYINLHGTEENADVSPVAVFQTWLNKEYGSGLDVDGKCGSKTKKAAVKAMQTHLNDTYNSGLSVDGSFGAASKKAYKPVKKGAKGNDVRIVQGLLYGHGYDPNGFDGSCGNGCVSAIKDYQKNSGLKVDGSCGKATFASLVG